MTVRKFFSCLFAIFGTALMVLSIGLCLLSLDAPVRMKEVPAGAQACMETFCEAVDRGDLGAISGLIYGQPELGAEEQPATRQGVLVWETFVNSMECNFSGDYSADQSGIARNVKITSLDISALMENLAKYAQETLNARITSAESLTEIYDESNNYREELVEQVLQEALQQALARDVTTVTREVKVKVIYRDGSWWILPDQALLQTISGLA